jgi:acetate---CoA ligase (ADP-forming) subunit beta
MTESSNITAAAILDKALREKRTALTEIEAKTLFNSIGINTVDTRLARSGEEAAAIGEQLGYPVVMKIAAQDILHKSDVGGVRLGLKNKSEVLEAYQSMVSNIRAKFPKASIEGVAVQSTAKPGIEIVIGMTKDPQFGPVLMFGLGGVLVEILKDVSFKVVPLTRRDAREMITEIKGYKLLTGYRGQAPVNTAALEDILLKLSDFCENTPAVKEIDLNPIFANSEGAVAVDARVILEQDKSQP